MPEELRIDLVRIRLGREMVELPWASRQALVERMRAVEAMRPVVARLEAVGMSRDVTFTLDQKRERPRGNRGTGPDLLLARVRAKECRVMSGVVGHRCRLRCGSRARIPRWGHRCRLAFADDVASCVDGEGRAVAAAEGAKVDHPAGARPGEGMTCEIAGGSAGAAYLTARVHVGGIAEEAPDGADVDHPARLSPEKGWNSALAVVSLSCASRPFVLRSSSCSVEASRASRCPTI
jgi:hypothetical protein